MTDDRKLASMLTADRLAEIEQELDAARSSAEPDWDKIEELSREAAALFVRDEDVQDGKQALYAALAQQQRPPIRIFRWGNLAAAAVAGIALFLVPAAIRMHNAIPTEPPPVQTDITVLTETTESITTAVTEDSQKFTQSTTTYTATNRTKTTASGTGSADTQTTYTQTLQTQTSFSAKTTVSSASSTTHKTETVPTVTSTQPTEITTEQSKTKPTATTDPPYHTTYEETTSCTTETTADQLQTVYFRTADAADHAQTVEGAELEIYDMEGNLVLSFRSGSSPVQAELSMYTTYRLHAVSVPEGWQMPLRDMIFELQNAYFDIYLRKIKEESP